ncbi:MAG TPA: hypothetical protein VLN59_01340 [Burkholderiales bacterium]|nr:hypothetical protein [Burkholderiales bacterium]
MSGQNLLHIPAKNPRYSLEWHLQNWAKWMLWDARPDGLPSAASGGRENYTRFSIEMWTVWEATNAAVEDLAPIEQCAIYHQYLQAMYRFPRGNFDIVLVRAKEHLTVGLPTKGVWLGKLGASESSEPRSAQQA